MPNTTVFSFFNVYNTSKIFFAYKVAIKNVPKKIQMPLHMYIFFETLNMMHLKSYLEKTIMNFYGH